MLTYVHVAFPYGIGCGLAGGNWEEYRTVLEEFAEANPQYAIVIVKKKYCEHIYSSTCKSHIMCFFCDNFYVTPSTCASEAQNILPKTLANTPVHDIIRVLLSSCPMCIYLGLYTLV